MQHKGVLSLYTEAEKQTKYLIIHRLKFLYLTIVIILQVTELINNIFNSLSVSLIQVRIKDFIVANH